MGLQSEGGRKNYLVTYGVYVKILAQRYIKFTVATFGGKKAISTDGGSNSASELHIDGHGHMSHSGSSQ